MKLVYVEWLDSYGVGSHWTSVKNIKTPDLTCKSVGWLISEDETTICVCPHITQDDHDVADYAGCGEMHIPLVAIVRLVELSIPDLVTAPAPQEPPYKPEDENWGKI